MRILLGTWVKPFCWPSEAGEACADMEHLHTALTAGRGCVTLHLVSLSEAVGSWPLAGSQPFSLFRAYCLPATILASGKSCKLERGTGRGALRTTVLGELPFGRSGERVCMPRKILSSFAPSAASRAPIFPRVLCCVPLLSSRCKHPKKNWQQVLDG